MHPYVELHCQSVFSLLDATSTPETLINVAHRLKYQALALTDFADLGGAVRFATQAKEVGLEAIVGVQIMTAIGNYSGRLVLLAENSQGYANLSKLVTHARMESARGHPKVSWSVL